jgi:hypothetical protein
MLHCQRLSVETPSGPTRIVPVRCADFVRFSTVRVRRQNMTRLSLSQPIVCALDELHHAPRR